MSSRRLVVVGHQSYKSSRRQMYYGLRNWFQLKSDAKLIYRLSYRLENLRRALRLWAWWNKAKTVRIHPQEASKRVLSDSIARRSTSLVRHLCLRSARKTSWGGWKAKAKFPTSSRSTRKAMDYQNTLRTTPSLPRACTLKWPWRIANYSLPSSRSLPHHPRSHPR